MCPEQKTIAQAPSRSVTRLTRSFKEYSLFKEKCFKKYVDKN